ncbi:MAG: NAD(P)-dependent oxidoreductase [Pirellulales bacterium]
MKHHVVITGATGFIGAAIAATMLRRGWSVTTLVRPHSNLDRLRELSGHSVLVCPGFADHAVRAELRERRPDAFVHCAWRGVSGADRNEKFQVQDNLAMTLTTVDLAATVGCQQWIGLGSQAEYGNLNRRIDENDSPRPTTLYGKAKLAAGIASLALCQAHGMLGTWLRVFSTYGPGDSPRWFLPYVIREFLAGRPPELTKCEQRWDYLYVDDAARAVTEVVETSAHGVFNLGSGSSRPLRDYVDAIVRELGCVTKPAYGAVPYRTDQVMHLEADISRLSTAVGWIPTTMLNDGIRATVAFERTRTATGPSGSKP